jgi:hypothetical protein
MAKSPKESIPRPMRIADLAFDRHKRGAAQFELRYP